MLLTGGQAATTTPPRRTRPDVSSLSPTLCGAGEALVAVTAALGSVVLSRAIAVDPLDRVGQVSGLAGLDLRFVLLGLLVLGVVGLAMRRASAQVSRLVAALGCAAVAGLTSGLIAGGLVVALRGTAWPLFANAGDSGQLIIWANGVLNGDSMPAGYPPLPVFLMTLWAKLTGASAAGALKVLQVGETALFGPVAYLSWRLLMRPPWALAVGLVAALPLIDLYKPYTNVVLVALLPVLIRFLRHLRRAADLPWKQLSRIAIGYGACTGILFLMYSGWFVWSALGVATAAMVVFPWRTGLRRGAVLVAITAVTFTVVSARHLVGLLGAAGSSQDRYFYFDTDTEPAYVAMWRGDTPGTTGPWPPPGEFAGMGVFSALLVVGLGTAVFLGRTRTDVLTIAACLAGAWIMRLLLASRMYATQAVQLYPRTTPEILYCLLLLTVLAAFLVTRRSSAYLSRWRGTDTFASSARSSLGTAGAPTRQSASAATVAVLASMLVAGLFMGSATADRYMPRNDGSLGYLAFMSHYVRQEDGQCAANLRPAGCLLTAVQVDQTLRQR